MTTMLMMKYRTLLSPVKFSSIGQPVTIIK